MKGRHSKRRLTAFIILLIAVLAGAVAFLAYLFQYSGVSQAASAQDRHSGDAHYDMDITPYYNEGALFITQTVDFTNGDTELDRIVFSLPVNAYRRSSTAPMDSDEFDAAFTDNYTPGGVEFKSITVNDSKVEWGVSGTREAVLTLLCDVAAGESVSVYMEYYTVMPEFTGAGGFDNSEWRLMDFYPRLGMLDDGEWTAYSPGYVGRYDCAPVGDYSITLHARTEYDVIASGSASITYSQDGWNTWQIDAYDVRNLAIVMRQGGYAYERDVNGVKIRVYCDNRLKARQVVDSASAIFERMNTIYEYPYPVLSIVMGDYVTYDEAAGSLILLNQSEDDMDVQLAYLVARQWFGEIVGNDSVAEPWLSTALAQYSALLCTRDVGLQSQNTIRRDIDAALGITLPGGLTVESETTAFSASTDYNNVLRYRGAAVMEMLDEAMDGDFMDALTTYVRASAFEIANRSDFIDALNSTDGSDWSAWLSETLQGIGKLG